MTEVRSPTAPRVVRLVAALSPIVAVLAGVLPTGCAAPPAVDAAPVSAEGPQASGTLADGTPWSIGALRPATVTLRAEDFTRPAGTVASLAIASGDRSGATLEERVLSEDGGGLVVEEYFRRDDGSYEYAERMRIRRGDDGALWCVSVDTPDEQVITLFPGDLLFAPSTLAPGGASSSASPMRTRPTGERIRRTNGRATRELAYVGDCEVTVGGRTSSAAVVDVVFVADLDLAKARRESRLFIVPGAGVVAERWSETIRILGLFPREAGQLLLLLDARTAPAESPEAPAADGVPQS